VNRKGWDIKWKRKDGREVDMKRCDVKYKEMKNNRNSRRFAPFFLALEGASRSSSKLIVNMFSLCTS